MADFESIYKGSPLMHRCGYSHPDLQLQGLGAAFEPAYSHLYKYEGGWVDDPADRGGETYRGIARKAWPAWAGWTRVDSLKRGRRVDAAIKAEIDGDATLKAMVKSFFKASYWDKYGFGAIADQSLAHITWDWTIGTNSIRMAAFAWKAMGRSGEAPAPKDVVRELAAHKRPAVVFDRFKKLRAAHHQNVVRNNPSQARFLAGWLKRNESFKYVGRTDRPTVAEFVGTVVMFGAAVALTYKGVQAYRRHQRKSRKAKFNYQKIS